MKKAIIVFVVVILFVGWVWFLEILKEVLIDFRVGSCQACRKQNYMAVGNKEAQ